MGRFIRRTCRTLISAFSRAATYRAEHGEMEIFAYKHCNTRRYLFLDNMGNCYRYAGIGNEKYQQITPREAFEHVYQMPQ